MLKWMTGFAWVRTMLQNYKLIINLRVSESPFITLRGCAKTVHSCQYELLAQIYYQLFILPQDLPQGEVIINWTQCNTNNIHNYSNNQKHFLIFDMMFLYVFKSNIYSRQCIFNTLNTQSWEKWSWVPEAEFIDLWQITYAGLN